MKLTKLDKQNAGTWFIVIFSIARFTMGAFFSITGPTLPILAYHMDIPLSKANWIYTIRSLAAMVGGLLPGLIFPCYPPLLFLSISIITNGITLTLIPVFRQFSIMGLAVGATGVTFGIADMGIQALILKSWGEKKSRYLIQLFHAMFAIGGFVAPLIAQGFISESPAEKLPESCKSNTSTDTSTSTTTDAFVGDDNIWIPYLICGCGIVVSGVLFGFLHRHRALDLMSNQNTKICDHRNDHKLTEVFVFFLFVFFNFYASQSMEVVFNAQIYTFARCNGFSVDQSTQINSAYWAAEALSRFAAIFIASRLSPPTYLGFAIVFGAVGSGFLYLNVVWAAVVVIGASIAMYFPCGVSFASMWTNMSGKYIGLFGVASTSGAMITPIINSYLMERNFNIFKATICVLQGFVVVSFLLMYFFGRRLKKTEEKSLQYVLTEEQT